ncbi:MAG: DUF2190 family protein [Pseudomonadota bacterium]
MKTYVQDGNIMTVPAPAAVASGGGVLIGSLFGIAQKDAALDEDVAIVTCGVFQHAKESAQAWTLGAKVYWDNTNKVMTTAASGNKLVGTAAAVAANPSPTGVVRLDGAAR